MNSGRIFFLIIANFTLHIFLGHYCWKLTHSWDDFLLKLGSRPSSAENRKKYLFTVLVLAPERTKAVFTEYLYRTKLC